MNVSEKVVRRNGFWLLSTYYNSNGIIMLEQ